MDNSDISRINARPGNYPGNGQSPNGRQQQRRQKILALFDAVNSANKDAAQYALQSWINFEPGMLSDPHFARLSNLLKDGNIYPAQQLVKEIGSQWLNQSAAHGHAAQAFKLPQRRVDGLSFFDVIA
jgi:hypothetical protein